MSVESSSGTPATAPEEIVYTRPQDYRAAAKIREKLFERGSARLSTTDLVAVVIGRGDKARDVVRRYGVGGMAGLSAEAWRTARLGEAAAARLSAVFELGRRAYGAAEERENLSRPGDVWKHVRRLGNFRKEHLVGLYLDAQNGLVHEETLSVGSLNTTRTHPREIMLPAIENLALGFILAHNHPSGSVEPSPEDLEFTRSVRRAGELMGIELYDHLIVTKNSFCSLRERGLL